MIKKMNLYNKNESKNIYFIFNFMMFDLNIINNKNDFLNYFNKYYITLLIKIIILGELRVKFPNSEKDRITYEQISFIKKINK